MPVPFQSKWRRKQERKNSLLSLVTLGFRRSVPSQVGLKVCPSGEVRQSSAEVNQRSAKQ